MATATSEAPKRQLTEVGKPVNEAEWEEEKALRKAERDAKFSLHMECLNPEVASDYEARKPKFEFDIQCTYPFRNPDTGMAERREKSAKVVAKNESDAWAVFCDKHIRTWPSRRACTLTITKGQKVA